LAIQKFRQSELAVKLVSIFTVGNGKECGQYPKGIVEGIFEVEYQIKVKKIKRACVKN